MKRILNHMATATLGLALAGATARAEFIQQWQYFHSYIGASDGSIRDTYMRTSLDAALDRDTGIGNYDDLVVVMGQCFGGGMLDDLVGIPTSSYQSAARWYEVSYSTDGNAMGRRGAYLDTWNRTIDSPAKPNMLAAYNAARDGDPSGPVRLSYQQRYGAKFVEHPQYVSSSSIGDSIKLADSNPAKAILFSGYDTLTPWINYHSLLDTYMTLKSRYGMNDADIYVMYPSATRPDGGALEFVRDAATKKADFDGAMTWLDGQTTANSKPDVLYWNGQQHGACNLDIKELIGDIVGAVRQFFSLAPEYRSVLEDLDTPGVTDRVIQLAYSGLSEGQSLLLNGVLVAELPAGSHSLELSIDPTQFDFLDSGNVLELVGGSSFDAFSQIELGMSANGVVPEPATLALLACGALGLIRRRDRA